MKSLLIVRHAKSSWDFNVEDFDRPLNQRGENDAPAMAKRLIKKDIEIDAFVSSPAKRAFTTATFFADTYGKKPKHIKTFDALYEPSIDSFYNTTADFDDDDKIIALFSHNPGITAFANSLGCGTIDDMPTCAIFAIKADIKKWKDFRPGKKEFWFFDYPKSQ